VTLLLNYDFVNSAKICLVSVFPDIVNDCHRIFLKSFENVASVAHLQRQQKPKVHRKCAGKRTTTKDRQTVLQTDYMINVKTRQHLSST